MSNEGPAEAIEIRIDDVAQLFHTLDPFPFRERDIDSEAEEYIVGWARELPQSETIRLLVHLPDSAARTKEARELAEAFSRHFDHRAEGLDREIKELFRIGRRSLAIGLSILVVCLLSSRIAGSTLADTPFRRLVEESLLILGWVANWRPLEIFLYDWWPLARRRRLYRRLAAAAVELRPYSQSPAIGAGTARRD